MTAESVLSWDHFFHIVTEVLEQGAKKNIDHIVSNLVLLSISLLFLQVNNLNQLLFAIVTQNVRWTLKGRCVCT